MTKLERRDRRRAKALWRAFCQDNLFNPPWVINFEPSAVLFIAAALKREREEAGFAAVNYFFARKADREKGESGDSRGTEEGEAMSDYKPAGCDCDLLEQPGSPPVCNEFRATPNNPAFCLICQHVEECHE